MDIDFGLRFFAALLAAIACTAWVVRRSTGPLEAPGFRFPTRRLAAFVVLTFMLLLACFQPLMFWDQPPEIDFENVSTPSLFLLQALLLFTVAVWFLAGYMGIARTRQVYQPAPLPVVEEGPRDVMNSDEVSVYEDDSEKGSLDRESFGDEAVATPAPVPVTEQVHRGWWRELCHQCGLVAERPLFELALGVGLGVLVWFAVLMALLVIGGLITVIFGPDAISQEPAEGVLLIVGMPIWVRIALSLAAGISEEIFFRGFLQARLGIFVASILFACAHLSYGQPTMLIGLTVLSFAYAFIVRWRGNVLAVIVAHAVFDLIQMLIMIPLVVRMQDMDVDEVQRQLEELLAAIPF